MIICNCPATKLPLKITHRDFQITERRRNKGTLKEVKAIISTISFSELLFLFAAYPVIRPKQ